MKILIAGATGFIGRALVRALTARGDELILLGRSRAKMDFIFNDPSLKMWSWIDLENTTESVDAVINLAGENIAGWWTRAKKNKMIDSRLAATKRIIAFCLRQKELGLPIHLFQGSGVGVYGIRDDRIYDEDTPHPQDQDFLSQLAACLEAVVELEDCGIPVTVMRFGVVLDPNGGLLEQLFPFFKYGLGFVLGTGKQHLTWIARVDVVRAILFLIDHPEFTGSINLVAKEPITQEEFAKRYARHLNRPLFIRIPRFLITLLTGEMGATLFLGGQRILPKQLLALGFDYEYPNLNYYFSRLH